MILVIQTYWTGSDGKGFRRNARPRQHQKLQVLPVGPSCGDSCDAPDEKPLQFSPKKYHNATCEKAKERKGSSTFENIRNSLSADQTEYSSVPETEHEETRKRVPVKVHRSHVPGQEEDDWTRYEFVIQQSQGPKKLVPSSRA